MSKEIQASFPCPHLIIEEPVTLGSDRRSMQTKAPIGGASTVRVLLNDQISVPPEGLYSPATLTASKPGPYIISGCEGNLLCIETGEGSTTITLPIGSRVSLKAVQDALQAAFDIVDVSYKGSCLSLKEKNTLGAESYIRVSGEAATSLGFTQTGSRGTLIIPGWELVAKQDPFPTAKVLGVNLVPARYPKFVSALKGNPTIKVTYVSMPERCPRCNGTYVENDYRFDPQGDLLIIENEDLLYQACLKAILTVKGSNPYHLQYGSSLTTRIGSKVTNTTAMLIKQDVIQALNNVKSLQLGQRKYQQVTNRELLYQIDRVDVRTATEDPTIFYLDVTIRNASNQPINITTVFTVPGTIALAGTNNQSLGLEPTGLSKRYLQEG